MQTVEIKCHLSYCLEVQCYKSDVAQLATLTECLNELLAHLAVQHPDVALPSGLSLVVYMVEELINLHLFSHSD